VCKRDFYTSLNLSVFQLKFLFRKRFVEHFRFYTTKDRMHQRWSKLNRGST